MDDAVDILERHSADEATDLGVPPSPENADGQTVPEFFEEEPRPLEAPPSGYGDDDDDDDDDDDELVRRLLLSCLLMMAAQTRSIRDFKPESKAPFMAFISLRSREC